MNSSAAVGVAAAFPDGGSYVLVLRLAAPLTLRIGALGAHSLPPGTYLYAGSARRGLRRRVARHLAREKRVHWHIDHLTTAPAVSPVGAVLVHGGPGECGLSRVLQRLTGQAPPVPRFGAGDCLAGCPAHLWHAPAPLTPAQVERAVAAIAGGTALLLAPTLPAPAPAPGWRA